MLTFSKTAVVIKKSRVHRKGKPGWINGDLPRPPGVKKIFVYHYVRGELHVTLMPVKNIVLAASALAGSRQRPGQQQLEMDV